MFPICRICDLKKITKKKIGKKRKKKKKKKREKQKTETGGLGDQR
jgi:hypothetical protein